MKCSYIILLLAFFCSCTKFDNKERPSMVLKGVITDSITGQGFQTQVGDNGIRFKMIDKNYAASPTPWYFSTQLDGAFQCALVPAGTYKVIPLGPFEPLIQLAGNGDTTRDASVTLSINGTVTQNFTVVPFLVVSWVGEPVVNGDSTITVQFKVDRGTTNPAYQQNLSNIYLFVNTSSTNVGDNNYDSRYTVAIKDPTDHLGQVITVTTPALPFKNATYYLRAGARIDYSVDGVNRYNYSNPIAVKVP